MLDLPLELAQGPLEVLSLLEDDFQWSRGLCGFIWAVERPGEAQGSRWTAAVNPTHRPRSGASRQERWCDAGRNGTPNPRHPATCGSGGWPLWTGRRAGGKSRGRNRSRHRNARSTPTQRRGGRCGPLEVRWEGSSPCVSGSGATVYRRGTRPDDQRLVRRAGRRPARWGPGPGAAMAAPVVEPGRASPDPLPSPVPRANPA